MLQGIRDKVHSWLAWVVVVLICIPFALWGIHEYMGGGTQIMVAKINSQEISKTRYEESVRDQMQRLRASLGGQAVDLAPFEERIKQSTLEQMVNEELLFQTAVSQRLRIGDGILAGRIHGLAPFQENGIFSQPLYEQRLRAENLAPTQFEQDMRRNLLVDQLQNGLTNSAFLTASEQKNYQALEDQQRLLSYLLIAADAFKDSIKIEEAEIASYFEAHQAEYNTPEKVSVNYVILAKDELATKQEPDEASLRQYYEEHLTQFITADDWQASHILIPSGADPKLARTTAEEVLKKIKAGGDFAALAKEYSKDPVSAEKGGDLGHFGPGAMVGPFETALKSMKPGEISELVESQFGYHIIKLVSATPASTKSFEQVHGELLEAWKKEQAETAFYNQTEQFANLSFEHPDSLERIASTLGLKQESSDFFSREGDKEGLFSNPKALAAAFSTAVLNEGYNSEVIELDKQKLMVLRLKEHRKAEPLPLAEVKDKIIETLKQTKAKAEAEALGKKVLAALQSQSDWQALLAEKKLNWTPRAWVKRQDAEFKQAELLSAAFKMGTPGTGQALYQGLPVNNQDYAVLAVLEVKPGAVKSDDKANQQLLLQQQHALGQSEFQNMLNGLKSRADIAIHTNNL